MKTVTATLRDKFQTDLYMGDHEFRADEPEKAGGDNTGPNPYDLVLASLAACTAMTVRWYANHKKLDLKGCRVTLEYDRIHARDCAACDKSDPFKKLEYVRRIVEIEGDFSDEEKEKLKSIPAKCPVSRTLKGGIVIEDEVNYE